MQRIQRTPAAIACGIIPFNQWIKKNLGFANEVAGHSLGAFHFMASTFFSSKAMNGE
jgi:hypothetical protein